jgi:hypothetical protein
MAALAVIVLVVITLRCYVGSSIIIINGSKDILNTILLLHHPLRVRYKDQGTTMRAMPFPEYISELSRNRLNIFYSVCQIFATSQVLFSYHLDEVFAGAVTHDQLYPTLSCPVLSYPILSEI